MKEMSILRFEQGIKSRQTLNNYRDHLEYFKNFVNFENFDYLISKPVEPNRQFPLRELKMDFSYHDLDFQSDA